MKSFIILVCMMIYHLCLSAQSADLTLKINNIDPLEGKIMVALFNSEETYFDKEQVFADFVIAADSAEVTCTFQDLPEGTYAITVYHDEDDNGEMNRNWIGIPKEGYAFSNNFTSAFRPASFNDAAFQLQEDTTLVISMVY